VLFGAGWRCSMPPRRRWPTPAGRTPMFSASPVSGSTRCSSMSTRWRRARGGGLASTSGAASIRARYCHWQRRIAQANSQVSSQVSAHLSPAVSVPAAGGAGSGVCAVPAGSSGSWDSRWHTGFSDRHRGQPRARSLADEERPPAAASVVCVPGVRARRSLSTCYCCIPIRRLVVRRAADGSPRSSACGDRMYRCSVVRYVTNQPGNGGAAVPPVHRHTTTT